MTAPGEGTEMSKTSDDTIDALYAANERLSALNKDLRVEIARLNERLHLRREQSYADQDELAAERTARLAAEGEVKRLLGHDRAGGDMYLQLVLDGVPADRWAEIARRLDKRVVAAEGALNRVAAESMAPLGREIDRLRGIVAELEDRDEAERVAHERWHRERAESALAKVREELEGIERCRVHLPRDPKDCGHHACHAIARALALTSPEGGT